MQIPQYGQEAGGQGLQVAEVGVIFLSRLISALGLCQPGSQSRPQPGPASGPSLVTAPRPLSAQSLLLASPRLSLSRIVVLR